MVKSDVATIIVSKIGQDAASRGEDTHPQGVNLPWLVEDLEQGANCDLEEEGHPIHIAVVGHEDE